MKTALAVKGFLHPSTRCVGEFQRQAKLMLSSPGLFSEKSWHPSCFSLKSGKLGLQKLKTDSPVHSEQSLELGSLLHSPFPPPFGVIYKLNNIN